MACREKRLVITAIVKRMAFRAKGSIVMVHQSGIRLSRVDSPRIAGSTLQDVKSSLQSAIHGVNQGTQEGVGITHELQDSPVRCARYS